MIKQELENTKRKFQLVCLIFTSVINGIIVWNISGIASYGYYGTERFSSREILFRWLLFPACILVSVSLTYFFTNYLFKWKKWSGLFCSSVICFNLSFLLFAFVNNVMKIFNPPIDHWDTYFSDFLFDNFKSFAYTIAIANVFVVSLTVVVFGVVFAASKIFIRKVLP